MCGQKRADAGVAPLGLPGTYRSSSTPVAGLVARLAEPSWLAERCFLLAAFALILMTAGCGGGSTTGGGSPGSKPQVTAVVVSCVAATIREGETSQCSAKVQGTGNFSSAVSWSASAGSVSSTGLFTAPVTPQVVTVAAKSMQDGTKSGSTTVTVEAAAPTITSVAVTCQPNTVAANATAQCSATVQGTGSFSSSVNWSVSSGTINSSGLFTAPSSPQSVLVTATSTQDTTKSGSVTVSVQAPSPTITSVSATCTPTSLVVSMTAQCNATVHGTGNFSSAVSWSASAGTITIAGLFTAPTSAATVTVTATSTQDTTKSGSASLSVVAAALESTHVVMVLEENKGFSIVVGNTAQWPNLNSLITAGALPLHYFADTHPSIGNYFMLITGAVLTNDDASTRVWDVDSIARRMLAAGVSFHVYAEGISRGYVGGNTGAYLIRHNPFAMLSDVANDPQIANQVILPFSQFAADAANDALPEFSFIVPDVNNDAHNGTPHQADAWLQSNVVDRLSSLPAFRAGGDGVLIVNFDEAEDGDSRHGGGMISPVFWGPLVKNGYTQTTTTVYQHESMLRTVMSLLSLSNPPGKAADAPPLTEFFKP